MGEGKRKGTSAVFVFFFHFLSQDEANLAKCCHILNLSGRHVSYSLFSLVLCVFEISHDQSFKNNRKCE